MKKSMQKAPANGLSVSNVNSTVKKLNIVSAENE
jgi:hypothetical protein